MIRTKKQGQLIVISGPSGVGKDTVCKELVKVRQNTWISVSDTTRSIRTEEINGVDYYYISKKEFENKKNNDGYLEYAFVHESDYYGTPKDKIYEKLNSGIDVILVIEIVGAMKVKEIIKEGIFIFILPPSMKELKNRITKRGAENVEKNITRFKNAYKEINEISKYNYVVVNDDINNAVEKINSILTAEKCRIDRIEEVYLNTLEEDIHEELLGEKI